MDAMQQELDMIDESLCNLEARRTELVNLIEQKKLNSGSYRITANQVLAETGMRPAAAAEIIF